MRLIAQFGHVMNVHQFPPTIEEYTCHISLMEPNFTYVIGHKMGQLWVYSKYFNSPQVLFYTTFCKNRKYGQGPRIHIFWGPGRSPARNRGPDGPRIRPVQLWWAIVSLSHVYNATKKYNLPCWTMEERVGNLKGRWSLCWKEAAKEIATYCC